MFWSDSKVGRRSAYDKFKLECDGQVDANLTADNSEEYEYYEEIINNVVASICSSSPNSSDHQNVSESGKTQIFLSNQLSSEEHESIYPGSSPFVKLSEHGGNLKKDEITKE